MQQVENLHCFGVESEDDEMPGAGDAIGCGDGAATVTQVIPVKATRPRLDAAPLWVGAKIGEGADQETEVAVPNPVPETVATVPQDILERSVSGGCEDQPPHAALSADSASISATMPSR